MILSRDRTGQTVRVVLLPSPSRKSRGNPLDLAFPVECGGSLEIPRSLNLPCPLEEK